MSSGNGGAREYEGWAWTPFDLLLLRETASCMEGSAPALLLAGGGELAAPAALVRQELWPRRVSVRPSGELPAPSWGSGG